MADHFSRKLALTVVVIIFDIGAILQTSSRIPPLARPGQSPEMTVFVVPPSCETCLAPTTDRVQAEFHGIVAEVSFQRLVQEKRHPGARGVKLETLSWLDLFSRISGLSSSSDCHFLFDSHNQNTLSHPSLQNSHPYHPHSP
jgi:hypothetical protein